VRQAPLLSPVPEGDEVEVIVPARALHELQRIIPDGDQPVQVAIQPNRAQLLFRIESDSPGVGTIELVSQLIQGTFPNFQQLIPKTYACRVVVNTQEFLKATRVAEIFARHNNDIVRLNIFPGEELAPGRLRVSARSEDTGENVGEIDATVDGDEAKIAFNVRYLKQALEVVDTPQVALEMTSPSSPGVIRPVNQDGFVHLIMPMFVNWD
jgi:DNA polymerase-3 subunit beta